MKDTIWKLFSQTGNIETYLLLKEIENDSPLEDVVHFTNATDQSIEVDVDS